MTPHEIARDLARTMRHAPNRDWREHWLKLLAQSEHVEWRRRICLDALANLGHKQRVPGEDDE